MDYVSRLVLVILCVSAGCVGDGNPPDSPFVNGTGQTDSSVPITPSNMTSSGVACNDDIWVGFWELNNKDVWDPNIVRVGYYLPSNSSVLLVAYVDGNMSGVKYIENRYDYGEHGDGEKIVLDSSLSGEHWVQVVAYSDQNKDGQFDQKIDKPCVKNGSLVRTDPYLIDFSSL